MKPEIHFREVKSSTAVYAQIKKWWGWEYINDYWGHVHFYLKDDPLYGTENGPLPYIKYKLKKNPNRYIYIEHPALIIKD